MTPTERAHAEAEVLAQNERFYVAFSEGSWNGMAALWAEHSPISCFHPGADLISGRQAVLGSWAQILRGAPRVAMRCERPRVQLWDETAMVLCYEASGDNPAHLAATNVFVLEGGVWKLVHHQAGPLRRPVRRPTSDLN